MKALVRFGPKGISLLAVALAALALVGVNLFSSQMLRLNRVDFTAERLYTISDATRKVLGQIDEPVTIRFYFSGALAERAPLYANYGARVRSLLNHYADISRGRLKVEVVDPEPFSSDEDRAIAAGLQAIPLGEGPSAYFGIVGENSTDQREVIAFLSAERRDFLEYDLTKLVHKLVNPRRKVVGIITDLPMLGGFDPRRGKKPDWAIVLQMREFFTVQPVPADSKKIPAPVDVLMIVTPAKMSDELARAVDQFALSGKPVVVFVDPWTESAAMDRELIGRSKLAGDDPAVKLLAAWGVKASAGKVLGDIAHARKVRFGSPGREQVASYLVWQDIGKQAFNGSDPALANVSKLIVGTPGALEAIEGAKTKLTPLVKSSELAMLMDVDMMAMPDPLALLNAYRPGGKSLILAARISGEAGSAYPAGASESEKAGKNGKDTNAGEKDKKDKAAGKAALKSGRVNVVVFADSDMLSDRFWAQRRRINARQELIIPAAGNATFVLNVLENLSGGGALAGLRGRGVVERPFTLVEGIRRKAEKQYRQREQELKTKLEEAEKRLSSISAKVQGGKVVLSEKDRETIVSVRGEILKLRRSLRDVQRALRSDIEKLGFWLKFVNIAGVAFIVGLIALLVALMRRRAERRARLAAREAN